MLDAGGRSGTRSGWRNGDDDDVSIVEGTKGHRTALPRSFDERDNTQNSDFNMRLVETTTARLTPNHIAPDKDIVMYLNGPITLRPRSVILGHERVVASFRA